MVYSGKKAKEAGEAGEAPRIGVFICHCGTNIAGSVDVKAVAEYAAGLPNVVIAEHYAYMCSTPGQNMIKEAAEKCNYMLDRQISSLEAAFIKNGGIRERMLQARLQERNKGK